MHDLLEFPEELIAVEETLHGIFENTQGLIREAGEYVLEGRGKSLRPRLVFLSARVNAPDIIIAKDSPVLRIAACVELLHTASLLHDDVVDNATLRRGRPSVNAQFGADVSILLADYLFSQAFQLIISCASVQALSILCETTRKMSASELRQIELRSEMLTEDNYLEIIESKTASLFSACAELGALISNAPEMQRAALAEYGRNLGMVFQIADDALDYTAADPQWGKSVGGDLAQGKPTLPLIHVFETATSIDRANLQRHLRNGCELSDILPLIEKYHGLEYARATAQRYATNALENASNFASGAARVPFESLCTFALDRGY
ncbi:TPA: hypothetical protein DDW35_13615 [Candidatus Sumerlaeota bacterium]|jgi:octaprenyl-diphosphate synthase|nr:hypothetical protein [Candidatus Sumerlaeota bacterium]